MPVGTVRPYDILILLAIGAIFEFATRILLLFYKRKPDSIRKREYALKVLEQRVKKSRALGPPSFVLLPLSLLAPWVTPVILKGRLGFPFDNSSNGRTSSGVDPLRGLPELERHAVPSGTRRSLTFRSGTKHCLCKHATCCWLL